MISEVIVMKVGIIRCMQTEDYCPGTTDFKFIKEKKGAFEGVEEDIEIVGFINCGGCPGKKAVLRARELVKRGADTIVFASCIQRGNPIGYPCPFAKKMKELIQKDLPEQIKYLDYTIKFWGQSRHSNKARHSMDIFVECLAL
jgi:predicted metal-binding protein